MSLPLARGLRPALHAVATGAVLSLAASQAAAQDQLWYEEFGAVPETDRLLAAAPNAAGGVFVGGWTQGELGGPPAGSLDAWLARYALDGNRLWAVQLGTAQDDRLLAVASDGAGGCFAAGDTLGALGGPQTVGFDAWLARYDGAGAQLWIWQSQVPFGDYANAASPDGAGGVFVAGETWTQASLHDAWLSRFDGAGTQLWSRQLATPEEDFALAAESDGSGGVYVAGRTHGDLGAPNAGFNDVWLARYDGAGNLLWVRQIGTPVSDTAWALAADAAGGVYVGGDTGGDLGGPNGGGSTSDGWLARYDGSGAQLWIRQFGTSSAENVTSMAPDGFGGVYALGRPRLSSYDAAGNQLWTRLLPSDNTPAAAPDGVGGVYAGGWTSPAGGTDAWLARYEGSCGVEGAYCVAKQNSQGCTPAITWSGTPSASHGAAFRIGALNVINKAIGILIYSTTGADQQPFQDGFLCVQSPVKRTAAQSSQGNPPPADCSGTYNFEFNDFIATGQNPDLVAGQPVWAQYWYRDVTSASGSGLSDGVSFLICP